MDFFDFLLQAHVFQRKSFADNNPFVSSDDFPFPRIDAFGAMDVCAGDQFPLQKKIGDFPRLSRGGIGDRRG